MAHIGRRYEIAASTHRRQTAVEDVQPPFISRGQIIEYYRFGIQQLPGERTVHAAVAQVSGSRVEPTQFGPRLQISDAVQTTHLRLTVELDDEFSTRGDHVSNQISFVGEVVRKLRPAGAEGLSDVDKSGAVDSVVEY